jgi:phage baseplate assembly protein W
MALIKQLPTKETQKQVVYYSDLQTNLAIHPNKKDLTTLNNEDSVKRSIRNILLTNRGEKLMNPLFGSDIRALLFENMNSVTESLLKDYISSSIANYEPRANVLAINVSALFDYDAYAITIFFSIINKKDPVTLELLINRIR